MSPPQPPRCLLSPRKKTLSPRRYTSPTEKSSLTILEVRPRSRSLFLPVCRQKATALKGDTRRCSTKLPSTANTLEPCSCSPTCVNGICARNDTRVSSSYLFWSQDYSRCLSRRTCKV